MPRTLNTIRFAGVLAVPAVLVACGSPAKYQEPGGTSSIVSVGEVDAQDLSMAANQILSEMIATGVLKSAAHQPARIRIERFVNDTSSNFPVDVVILKMREQLVNSGQAQVVTAYGSNPESKESQDALKQQAFREGKASVDSLDPDFFLTGKVEQLKRSAGSTKQSNYYFSLTLTDARTGREVFTKLAEVQKQGTKNSVGF